MSVEFNTFTNPVAIVVWGAGLYTPWLGMMLLAGMEPQMLLEQPLPWQHGIPPQAGEWLNCGFASATPLHAVFDPNYHILIRACRAVEAIRDTQGGQTNALFPAEGQPSLYRHIDIGTQEQQAFWRMWYGLPTLRRPFSRHALELLQRLQGYVCDKL